MNKLFVLAVAMWTYTSAAMADTVRYEFDVRRMVVNVTGEPVEAMAIGGTIPAPLIEARVGDTLEVTFHNRMDVETSVHWHGILLPPEQDGVPWLNTKPIPAGGSHTFRFDITHSGTYWYHSHTDLQEQRGIYGPIRLLPPEGEEVRTEAEHDVILVWSDWTNENPKKVLRNLKRDGHYYARKKGAVQSWAGMLSRGWPAIRNRLQGALDRMEPMDISDVGYDAHLANGEPVHQLVDARPGETVRVRMINAAASSYFNVEFAGGPMTIVSSDGVDIEPLRVQRLEHAIAETWDVLVRVPDSGAFELRATNVDGTGHASAFIGSGERLQAPEIKAPDLYLVDHSSHMGGDKDHGDHEAKSDSEAMDDCSPEHAAMGHCTLAASDDGLIDHLTTYEPLRAIGDTRYDDDMPVRTVHLKLNGDMEKYVWSFNGLTLSEADRILIRKGERVRFVFENTTMMNHPLHLHGHFFRVLNGQGDRSPLKHTFDLASLSTMTIEFAANEEADWIFHCHNLYHMKAGMSRVISYQDSSRIDDGFARSLSMDDMWYHYADLGLLHNQYMGRIWSVNNRYRLSGEWEGDFDGGLEAEVMGEYFVNRFTEFMIGGEHEREADGHRETHGFVGVSHVLPLLLHSKVKLRTDGKLVGELGSKHQLTDRTRLDWHVDTRGHYKLMLDYEVTKSLSFVAKQGSEFGAGIGLIAKF